MILSFYQHQTLISVFIFLPIDANNFAVQSQHIVIYLQAMTFITDVMLVKQQSKF